MESRAWRSAMDDEAIACRRGLSGQPRSAYDQAIIVRLSCLNSRSFGREAEDIESRSGWSHNLRDATAQTVFARCDGSKILPHFVALHGRIAEAAIDSSSGASNNPRGDSAHAEFEIFGGANSLSLRIAEAAIASRRGGSKMPRQATAHAGIVKPSPPNAEQMRIEEEAIAEHRGRSIKSRTDTDHAVLEKFCGS